MRTFFKIIKARWKQFKHCLIYTIKNPSVDHRMLELYNGNTTIFLGCCCGKIFYDKNNSK